MKKIMFNDRYGLTKAVLQGRKTITRRIMKPQPSRCDVCKPDNSGRCIDMDCQDYPVPITKKPPYKVGEIVSVAQSYFDILDNLPDIGDNYIYHGSKSGFIGAIGYHYRQVPHSQLSGWANKMFVKSLLMPHQIRIVSVRAERLQDITEEDCLREGIIEERPEFYDLPTGSEKIYFHYHNFNPNAPDYNTFGSAKEAFASLVDKISGRGTWATNPYVWRIEFELVK